MMRAPRAVSVSSTSPELWLMPALLKSMTCQCLMNKLVLSIPGNYEGAESFGAFLAPKTQEQTNHTGQLP